MTKRSYASTLFQDLSGHPMPSKVEVSALRATSRGDATEAQQRLAFRYILELTGMNMVPNPSWSATESAYAQGSRAVGILISALANTPVAEIEDEHGGRDPDSNPGSDT